MSDRALSEAAMRANLQDIRLPPAEPWAGFADLLLAAGLGGVLALGVGCLLRLWTRRKVRPPKPPTLQERIASLKALPPDQRRVASLHLLREVAPDRYARLRPGLYRADSPVDPEAEVARLA